MQQRAAESTLGARHGRCNSLHTAGRPIGVNTRARLPHAQRVAVASWPRCTGQAVGVPRRHMVAESQGELTVRSQQFEAFNVASRPQLLVGAFYITGYFRTVDRYSASGAAAGAVDKAAEQLQVKRGELMTESAARSVSQQYVAGLCSSTASSGWSSVTQIRAHGRLTHERHDRNAVRALSSIAVANAFTRRGANRLRREIGTDRRQPRVTKVRE